MDLRRDGILMKAAVVSTKLMNNHRLIIKFQKHIGARV